MFALGLKNAGVDELMSPVTVVQPGQRRRTRVPRLRVDVFIQRRHLFVRRAVGSSLDPQDFPQPAVSSIPTNALVASKLIGFPRR